MKNRITALAIVSTALISSSAFGQQNDQRNRNADRQQSQPSRSDPSNERHNQQTYFNGNANNRNAFQPSRPNYSPSQPRINVDYRQNPPVNQAPHTPSWTRTWPNFDQPRNDTRPPQQHGDSWNRSQPTTARSYTPPPVRTTTHNWGSESWNPAPPRNHGVEFGRAQSNHPQTQQSAQRPNPAPFKHVVVPTMPQPKPAGGGSWNVGRNIGLLETYYNADAGSHNLQVHPVAHLSQRSNWGGHWREGYSGWQGANVSSGFRATGFSFSLYLFTPFYESCEISPFYYYSCLPPYIAADQCHVVRNYSCSWNEGNAYHANDGSYTDENLDNATARLQEAFNQQDFDSITSLMPTSGSVGIFTDGAYDYSLPAQDFESLMADAVTNTDTVSFEITGVRWFDGGAIIQARNEVRDPDGTDEVVYQSYRLRYEDGNLVITDMMTSH